MRTVLQDRICTDRYIYIYIYMHSPSTALILHAGADISSSVDGVARKEIQLLREGCVAECPRHKNALDPRKEGYFLQHGRRGWIVAEKPPTP